MNEVFDNRSKLYISQTVPVKAGDGLRFSLLLHDGCNCCEAWILIRADSDAYTRIPMEWSEKINGEFNLWTAYFVPEKADIYWYRFEFEGNWRRNIITNVGSGKGDITDRGGDWQLTVYEPDFTVPDKFYGGLIYQIFPDRFYDSGTPKADIPDDRYTVSDWYSVPAWRQNNGAQSLCNDYYGGDLNGITEKLGYIASLGVTVIYLNPIFEAHSNHRYNTADYMKIDPSLGTEEDFVRLCAEAKKRGISVILDGVFSHTGDDSRYFNKYGRYPETGAYQSTDSKWYSWYRFEHWPDRCSCWWEVPSLPETAEDDPSFTEFICGENGVLRHWLRLGASGWRLDVADELPDSFLCAVRDAVKAEKPDAVIIGEVWEDASNKISYGSRRRFLLGRELDTVMNYPFRSAIIGFITGGDGARLNETVSAIIGNYPPCAVNALMNHIGTHDTERILSVLGGAPLSLDREAQSSVSLDSGRTQYAKKMLRLAAVLQYTLPGIPSLYYGDEAGLEGLRDPFNRMAYPWGREDGGLTEFYRSLGKLRRDPVFKDGRYISVTAEYGLIAYLRQKADRRLLIAVNRTETERTFSFEGKQISLPPTDWLVKEI